MPDEQLLTCPETGAKIRAGKEAVSHARRIWLTNPNVGEADIKGEAKRRYEWLTTAKPGDKYESNIQGKGMI